MSTRLRSSVADGFRESTTAGTGNRSRKSHGYPTRYLKLLVALLVMAAMGTVPVECDEGEGLTPGQPSLKSVFSEIELVRCLFDEGRLVVRRRGEMKVLHGGENWAEAGLKILTVDGDEIVIVTMESEVLPSGRAVPKAMAILSRGLEGQVRIRTFTSESPNKAIVFESPEDVSVP